MQRRQFLTFFSRVVYAGCGFAVVGTIARFLGAPLASSAPGPSSARTRLATLNSLPVGTPRLLAVEGTRTNAWVRHPSQVIGNVWVTRWSDEKTPPEETKLSVFNAACPHNGCPIQKAASKGYACHCHGARFTAKGNRVANNASFTNPAPRGMDPLEYAVVQDSQTDLWWVEVAFQSFETGLTERVATA